MLRDTMIRTMPVAMIAIEALWTERFQRLRGERNVPPDRKLKPIQMISSAPSMPSMRVSISRTRSRSVIGESAALRESPSDRGAAVGCPSVDAFPGAETLIYATIRRKRPAPCAQGQGVPLPDVRADHPQAETLPAGTPWHRSALVTQPASRTSLRLACVIGFGVRKIELSEFPPGVLKADAPVTLLASAFLHSCIAASPALLPRARASFQTSTVWVPSATRLRAALSPSWPETGTLPARPCAVRVG